MTVANIFLFGPTTSLVYKATFSSRKGFLKIQLSKPTFEIDLLIAFGKMITAGKYFICINIFLLGDGYVICRMEMAR